MRAASRRPRSAPSSSRPSAGTRSPASSRIRSPGTSCSLVRRCHWPSRRRVTRGWAIWRRASRAFWAWLSCRYPSRALRPTISTIAIASLGNFWALKAIAAEIAATASNINNITLLNWSQRMARLLRPAASSRRLGPLCSLRSEAWAVVNPSVLTLRLARQSSALRLCQWG